MHTLRRIQEWTAARVTQGTEQLEEEITELCYDTRALAHPQAALFVALRGQTRAGSRFAADAYAQGVRAFLLDAPPQPALPPDACVLLVDDALAALQAIGGAVRGEYAGPVVGITGSNGKTVVKEWLYALTAEDGPMHRSPRSFNSQIGVPVSLWPLTVSARMALIEVGISQRGEMTRLARIVRPTHGIFTHLGEAHSAGFSSLAEKAAEKLQLFADAEYLIYNRDQEALHAAVVAAFSGERGPRLLGWSRVDEGAPLYITSVEATDAGHTKLRAQWGGVERSITIPFADAASIENALHCWTFLLLTGVPDEAIAARMARLQPVAMRLEVRRGLGGSTLINDAYNADLTSLRIGLQTLLAQRQHGDRRTLILSDLEQSGVPQRALYTQVSSLLRRYPVQRLLGVGAALVEESNALQQALPGVDVQTFSSTENLLEALPRLTFRDEAVLVKGARSYRLERVAAALDETVHSTVLQINLSALAANLRAWRSLLQPGVKTMAMVKALAYGSGTYEVAQALEQAGADYLAVAYPDEGVALRRVGITLPIMVMSPDTADAERCIRWALEPEVYSLGGLQAFDAAAQRLSQGTPWPVHIKLDTGMHRLGFSEADLPALIPALQACRGVRVASVFSHLAGSEEPALDEFTAQQAAAFRRLSDAVAAALDAPFMRHLANSAAVARHPELHFDMVRLGIGLYGLDGSGKLGSALQPVSTLRSTIAQIRTVPAGDTIGYGRRGRAASEARIATVRIGYADGYPRAVSPAGGYMLVRGRRAPLVGSVCMDLCMIDVTRIPGAREGDEVIVFGPGLPVEQVATWAGTIPYEIMTGISARVRRVYWREE